MGQCSHEEADARLVVHVLNALQYSVCVLVHTSDTDVVVVLLANFQPVINVKSAANIWIHFKVEKSAWFHLATSPINLEQLFVRLSVCFTPSPVVTAHHPLHLKGSDTPMRHFRNYQKSLHSLLISQTPFFWQQTANCDGVQIRMSSLFEQYISRHTNRQH